jgi:hypothetical protein
MTGIMTPAVWLHHFRFGTKTFFYEAKINNDINFFYSTLLYFKFYMLLCGNNALEQKTVHSSMAYYVHVLLYNAAKQMFMC